MNAIMDLHAPYNAGNFLYSSGPVGFSGRILLYGVEVMCTVSCYTSLENTSRV